MINSLIESYTYERIEEFNDTNHQTLEDGYEKFTSVLSQIEVSEELEMELENIFNSQINEAVRLAYLTAMKRGFLLGMQLMDELRKKM